MYDGWICIFAVFIEMQIRQVVLPPLNSLSFNSHKTHGVSPAPELFLPDKYSHLLLKPNLALYTTVILKTNNQDAVEMQIISWFNSQLKNWRLKYGTNDSISTGFPLLWSFSGLYSQSAIYTVFPFFLLSCFWSMLWVIVHPLCIAKHTTVKLCCIGLNLSRRSSVQVCDRSECGFFSFRLWYRLSLLHSSALFQNLPGFFRFAWVGLTQFNQTLSMRLHADAHSRLQVNFK